MGMEKRGGAEKPDMGDVDMVSRPAEAPGRKGIVRRVVLLGVLGAALAAGGHYGWSWWTEGRFMVETDDAYVHADFAVLAPKVTGYVTQVLAKENQPVKEGDVLVIVDQTDYQSKLDEIDARIAAQKATVERLERQIDASDSGIAQAHAQRDAAQANLSAAISDYNRYKKLAETNTASAQKLDAAKAARDSGYASVREGEASVSAAEAAQSVAEAERAEAIAQIRTLDTERRMALNDLDSTVLRAPYDGMIGNLAVTEGDFVTPGKRLMAVVPLDQIYVDANFKETQLAALTPGTVVHLHVDAFPDRDVVGHVQGVAPASGAVFSLLPPENATGNFTKIVQRFPVRIAIPKDVAAEGWLLPGMSVVAEVDTRPHALGGAQAATAK